MANKIHVKQILELHDAGVSRNAIAWDIFAVQTIMKEGTEDDRQRNKKKAARTQP